MHDDSRSLVARTGGLLIASAAALAALAAILPLHAAASDAAPATGTVISTRSSNLGRILVDSHGRTLYLFARDRGDKSTCAGPCATYWPPATTTSRPRAGTGASASLLGTTKRSDGRLQVTYNDHPLYRFDGDSRKGELNGEGLRAFGAHWYVVSPAGAEIT